MPVDPKRLSILHYPAVILRQRGKQVDEISAEVRAVAERMHELMIEAEGVGLAAPQVGLPWRLFVTAARESEPARVFINPVIHEASDETDVAEEGCLSIPDVRVEIRRPVAVTIKAHDLEGNEFTVSGEGLTARIWQHELDHLDGVLIIDRMGPMDRIANRRAIRNLEGAM